MRLKLFGRLIFGWEKINEEIPNWVWKRHIRRFLNSNNWHYKQGQIRYYKGRSFIYKVEFFRNQNHKWEGNVWRKAR